MLKTVLIENIEMPDKNKVPVSPDVKMDLQPENLENDLIRLIPVRPDDFEKLYAVAADPSIWEQHPNRNRHEREVFQEFFDEALRSKNTFLVVDQSSGQAIGSSRFYDYDREKRSVAIGYTFLARAFWGSVYNKALKTLMLDYAFRYVDTVIFHIAKENLRSQKATKKSVHSVQTRFRKSCRWLEGRKVNFRIEKERLGKYN